MRSVQVVFQPYTLFGPPGTSSPFARGLPTANPPPAYVLGSLAFTITNTGNSNIRAGWSFNISNVNYTSIPKVGRLNSYFESQVHAGQSHPIPIKNSSVCATPAKQMSTSSAKTVCTVQQALVHYQCQPGSSQDCKIA